MMTALIKYRGAVPSELARREQAKINKDGFRQLGVYWVARFREKHFTRAGATEYGYAPRQGDPGRPNPRGFRTSYQGRKLKKFGHTRPLMYTGDSEEQTRTARVEVTGTSKKTTSRVVMRAPKLNFRYRNSQIDMRAELTTVSVKEQTELWRLLGNILDRKYRLVTTSRTVRV